MPVAAALKWAVLALAPSGVMVPPVVLHAYAAATLPPLAEPSTRLLELTATVALVVDVDLLPQNGRVALVVLQDGRQLEGELHSMSGRCEIGGETFDAWEIEMLEDVT